MGFFKKFVLKSSKVDLDCDINGDINCDHGIAKTFLQEIRSAAFLKNEKMEKRKSEVFNDEKAIFKMVTDNDLECLKSIGKNCRSLLTMKDQRGKSLLHLATSLPDTNLLHFLLQTGMDIQAKDNEGNSSLHDAVEHNNPDCISFLLSNGADITSKNNKELAPIHVAVDMNRVEALKRLLDHPTMDPDMAGAMGATPLHYAAWKDVEECAKLLLENNAQLSKPNKIGSYPLHVAAQCSAYNTLTIFIKHLERQNKKMMTEIMNKFDYENNTVLHSAVVGGHLKVVETILEAGADLKVKQTDGNTAVHMAASQGNVKMLETMFAQRPDEKECCQNDINNVGHTPLMEAAMLDRDQVVEYLSNEGSDINHKSMEGSSAMILAASKKAWKCVSLLLGLGADPKTTDSHGHNLLHLIILGGGQPCGFDFCITKSLMKKMLNQMDQHGCTPLHYASEHGFIKTIDQLIKLGARINAKSNKQQSALHFASKFGRINTCSHLLSNACSSSLINEADLMGQTALHLAAEQGHDNVVSMLLTHGAGIFRDINGNTPLHLAAKNGYTHTMKALLSIHTYLLDLVNKNKNTCLHLAVMEDQPAAVIYLLNLGARILPNEENVYPLELGISKQIKDSCVAIINHSRWRESLSMKSALYGCPMVGMIEMLPELCQMVLDRCRTASEHEPKSPMFHYRYDFSFLQAEHDVVRTLKKKGIKISPLITLNMMVKYHRVECLYHPVAVAYLNNKWLSYGLWVHLTLLMMYIAFLCCLNLFVINFDFDIYHEALKPFDNSTTSKYSPNYMDNITTSQKAFIYLILCFAIFNILKEFTQMKSQKGEYFKDKDNLTEWIFYILLLFLVLPFFFNVCNSFQWQAGSVAIFMAWFNLLLHLQRFEHFGIYVVMFLEILQTLVRVIMVFVVLILAFGFSFYISLHEGNSPSFSTPGLSIMTSAVMMLGSIDYQQVWVDADYKGTLPNKTLNYMFLAFFILIMPILLINLLIGLAVGDIEAVLKNAKMKTIAMQVQLHTDMEQKLPLWLIKMVDKPFLKVYPNATCSSFFNRMTRASIQISASDFDVSEEMKTNVEHHSYLYRELHQQKLRTKQLMKEMTKQYDMLKLIVSKMEISQEMDDENKSRVAKVMKLESPIGWSSCALKQTVLKQAFTNPKW